MEDTKSQTTIDFVFSIGIVGTIGCLFLFMHSHLKPEKEDPEIAAEYSQCLEDGGREADCNKMRKELHAVRFGEQEAASACEAARAAALSQCITGLEDHSYSGGELEYKARTRSDDTPLCERIATAAFDSCRIFNR